MIWTSSGKYFSNAAISTSLQEVWPPTMAPCLVAALVSVSSSDNHVTKHTRPIFAHDSTDGLCFHTIQDNVA